MNKKKNTPKPLSYYVYETPKISIIWKGKIQPFGKFKSAEEALNKINQICKSNLEVFEYSILTPEGIVTH